MNILILTLKYYVLLKIYFLRIIYYILYKKKHNIYVK